jgi:hypothetical protein
LTNRKPGSDHQHRLVVPAPEGLKQSDCHRAEAYTGSLGPVETNFHLGSISIANGL